MALHPDFPRSSYDILDPDIRWFPADEALRESSYEKLLPPDMLGISGEIFPIYPAAIASPRRRLYEPEASRDCVSECGGRCQFIQHISLAGSFHGFRVQSPVL